MGSLWSLAMPTNFEICLGGTVAEDFEPRIRARSSGVVQSDSASKKRQHLWMEFMPEVLFSTW